MTNTATKLKRALCSMVVMLALMAGISAIPAYAASPDVYKRQFWKRWQRSRSGRLKKKKASWLPFVRRLRNTAAHFRMRLWKPSAAAAASSAPPGRKPAALSAGFAASSMWTRTAGTIPFTHGCRTHSIRCKFKKRRFYPCIPAIFWRCPIRTTPGYPAITSGTAAIRRAPCPI